MRYLEHPLPSRLTEHVECVWTLEAASASAPERVLPDGTVELVLHYEEAFEQLRDGKWNRQPQAFVVGPMSRWITLRGSPGARVLGIRLRAPAAAALLRVPLRELVDDVVPLDELGLGGFADALFADDWQPPDVLARHALRALDARRARLDERNRLAAAAMDTIFAQRGRIRVRELAGELGVGERRLERAFDAAVGLSPKRLARVARLQAILLNARASRPSLAVLAVGCGYSDQAHMTREFRQLAGIAPATFLAQPHALSDLFSPEDRLERLLHPRQR